LNNYQAGQIYTHSLSNEGVHFLITDVDEEFVYCTRVDTVNNETFKRRFKKADGQFYSFTLVESPVVPLED
jgi:hypothetical protein